MSKPFQSVLNWVAKHFKDDASKMIIWTSVAGYAISSLAQVFAIVANPKIKNEQKGFLIPQEIYDAMTNIGAYFLITLFTKRTVSKLFSTGKWATKNVRKYLNEHADLYSKKIGKIDFNMDKVMEKAGGKLTNEYEVTKSFGTTAATIGAGILAANIVTPLIRNKMASRIQKSYIEINKSLQEEQPQHDIEKPNQTSFKANPFYETGRASLKI